MERNLISETRTFLIDKKEQYNEDIEDIIYSDLESELGIIDLRKLSNLRKQIKLVYEPIERLDKFEEMEND